MKNKFKKLIKDARKITLTQEEKFNARNILEAHMENHPVINEREISHGYARSKIKPILTFKFMPLILALLVALGGGTALAANSSAPGEFFYPVKTGFNEQIREILTLTKESKAEYQSDLVAKRIEEIQELAVEGRFNGNIREEVEKDFERHTEKTLRLIERLEEEGDLEIASEISSRFEALLDAHEELINELSENNENVRLHLEGILGRVSNRLKTVEEIREKIEKHIGSDDDGDDIEDEDDDGSARLETAAEIKLEQSERAIERAKELLSDLKSVLSENQENEIDSRIDAAEEAHADGVKALEDDDPADAFRYFQSSLRLTHQVQIMARSWTHFGNKFGNGGDDSDSDSDDEDEDDSDEEDEDDEDEDDSDEEDNEDEDEDDDDEDENDDSEDEDENDEDDED